MLSAAQCLTYVEAVGLKRATLQMDGISCRQCQQQGRTAEEIKHGAVCTYPSILRKIEEVDRMQQDLLARSTGVTDNFDRIYEELVRAQDRFGPFNSGHEGYAVILEELDEMWDAIKVNDIQQARQEAVQVAAMALRFLLDIEPKKE